VGRAVAEMSLASAPSNARGDADGGREPKDRRRRIIADTPSERDRYAMDRGSIAGAELLRDQSDRRLPRQNMPDDRSLAHESDRSRSMDRRCYAGYAARRKIEDVAAG
jgi:hypothetical protein